MIDASQGRWCVLCKKEQVFHAERSRCQGPARTPKVEELGGDFGLSLLGQLRFHGFERRQNQGELGTDASVSENAVYRAYALDAKSEFNRF